ARRVSAAPPSEVRRPRPPPCRPVPCPAAWSGAPSRRRPDRAGNAAPGLLAPELLDLLKFGLGELAGHVVPGDLLALHVVADVVDDLGVGQSGDVADVGGVGDRSVDPAHDLPGPGLGDVGHEPEVTRPGYFYDCDPHTRCCLA